MMRRVRCTLSDSDNKAISVQVQLDLDLPTGTELGNNRINKNKFLDQMGPYPPLPPREIGLTCIQIIQEVHRPNFNCNSACRTLPVYLSGWVGDEEGKEYTFIQ